MTPYRFNVPYVMQDSPVVTVAYLGLVVASAFVVVSILSIVAEIRHRRYALRSEGRDAVKQIVPYVASLPCREEQEQMYVAASKWVDACCRAGVLTWIVGETRTASFDGGVLYPWSRHLYFGYVCADTLTPTDECILLTKMKKPPSSLEPCSIGILKQTQREPKYGPLKSRPTKVTCSRRDFLDRFRFPMRRQDEFTTFIASE